MPFGPRLRRRSSEPQIAMLTRFTARLEGGRYPRSRGGRTEQQPWAMTWNIGRIDGGKAADHPDRLCGQPGAKGYQCYPCARTYHRTRPLPCRDRRLAAGVRQDRGRIQRGRHSPPQSIHPPPQQSPDRGGDYTAQAQANTKHRQCPQWAHPAPRHYTTDPGHPDGMGRNIRHEPPAAGHGCQ